MLEPDELDAIKLESKKLLDLVQFVDVKDIDPRYFERPYYLVPQFRGRRRLHGHSRSP